MVIHRTQITHASFDEISSSLQLDQGERSLLPSFLVELSNRSMQQLNDRAYSPREVSILDMGIEDEASDVSPTLTIGELEECKRIPLTPSDTSRVVAIDVSSLRIGETETGALVAIRGAVVWRSDRGYQYVRCGPLTFHLRNGGEEESPRDLSSIEFSRMFAQRAINRLRNTLERWIQLEICNSFQDAIVLFDGSLTAGTPDNPASHLLRILKTARERGSIILAFSKSTKLCVFGKRITSLVSGAPAPCLVDVDEAVSRQFKSHPVHLSGHVYVAKLVEDGFSFRLDIDRQVPQHGRIEAVNRLISSDVVMQGYPETLRLAHIFCTFTANDVIATQRYLARAYGLRIAPRFSVRKSLFGPFGHWEAA